MKYRQQSDEGHSLKQELLSRETQEDLKWVQEHMESPFVEA